MACLGVAAVLGGCTLLPEQGPEPAPRTYLLAPAPPGEGRLDREPGQPVLLVTPPQAQPGYATPQIAYTVRPYELSFYARNEWLDIPSRMLRSALVNALERSGGLGAVVTEPNAALGQFRLDTEIVRLVHDLEASPHRGTVALRAQLTDMARREVIGTRILRAHEPSTPNTPYGAVIAMNRALARIIEDLVAFCLDALSANQAR